MTKLGIESISVFGLPRVEFVELARDLGCSYVTTGLESRGANPFGYPGFSLREREARRELVSAMDACGVSVSLGEGFLVQPGVNAGEASAADLELMAELGVTRILTVSFEPDFQRNVDQFGALAETASRFGIETLLEFVPIFAIADLATGHELVRKVARPDFRLLVDTMHVARCGASAADLAAIDPELIGYVQLCDAPLKPAIADYMEEAMYERMVPGEGELPLLDMLAALPRDRVLGLEVPLRAEAVAAGAPHEPFGRCVAATRSLLSRLDAPR